MKKENKKFLKSLSEKTVTWSDVSMRTNISLSVFNTKMSSYTNYVFSLEDFKKIFEILEEENDIFLMPQESLMGWIDGYNIYSIKKKLLLRFGKSSIPAESGYTLETIFNDFVRSERNLKIYQKVKDFIPIKDSFDEYCY